MKRLVIGVLAAAAVTSAAVADPKATLKPIVPALPGAKPQTPAAAAPSAVSDACVASIIAKRNAPPPSDPAPGAKPPVPTDSEKAYFAFEQGQYQTAMALAEAAAGRGDPQAHTLMARIYDEGLGVHKDPITAARWYARGAELCDVPALFEYGLMLAQGRGVGKDRVAAAEMLEKAAISGHALANYNLGLIFLKGDGKPQNPFRAAQHIRYAAEKGVAAAQYDIAVMYQLGNGVQQDMVEAAKWYNRAAAAGSVPAEYDYAVLLLKGLGLERDKPKAITYLKAAADHGMPGAQNRLANIYFEGAGIEKSMSEAAKWRLIAKHGGVADEKLDAEIAKLSAADRTRAERAASDWLDSKSATGGNFPLGDPPPPAPPKSAAAPAAKPGK